VPALIGYLRSSYFVVRQAAVAALVRFGPTVVKLILPTLSYNRSDIKSLKRDACEKKHPELQLRAIKALGGWEDHRAVELLRELVDQGLPDVQDAAMQALVLIGCASWGRCCALRVLAEVGDASLAPKVIPSLQDDSDKVRVEAIRALGRLGGQEAVKHLVRVSEKDPADCLRAEAMRLLRTVGTGQPGVLEAARRGLNDCSRDVRSLAARLLGIFQDPKSILPLLKAMTDPHWSVRESAENALLNFGHSAVGALTEALRSPLWTTRFRTARLLGEIGDPKAAPALENLLARRGEKTKVRDVARDSLAKLRPEKRAS
jgi:HEAT repeat protein